MRSPLPLLIAIITGVVAGVVSYILVKDFIVFVLTIANNG